MDTSVFSGSGYRSFRREMLITVTVIIVICTLLYIFIYVYIMAISLLFANGRLGDQLEHPSFP